METTTNNPQFLPSNNSDALRRGARKPSVAAGTVMLTSSAVADEGGETEPAYMCFSDGPGRADGSYIHYDTDQGHASDVSQIGESDDESSLTTKTAKRTHCQT